MMGPGGQTTKASARDRPAHGWLGGALRLACLLVVCVLATAGLLWSAASAALVAAGLSGRGAPAEAVVVAVDHKSIASWPGGLIQGTDITVAFTDNRGRRVLATGQEGSASRTRVGERLRIVYDPRDPAHVRWNGSSNPAGLELLWAGLFLVADGVLGWMTWKHWQGRPA